jgi:HEAT repeat protein
LGKIGDQKAEPFLLRALHDSDSTVREAAARSMGRLSAVGVEAGTELVALLRDPDTSVRHAAAQALGAGGVTPAPASAVAGLLTSPDPAVRQAAGHALLLVDAREAFVALSKGVTDTDPAVRQWVVAALGESGDSRAVPVLLDRLRHDSVAGVRTEAAYRLRFVGNGLVAAELETIMQRDSSRDVKRWAEKSLMDSGRHSTPIQRLN